MLFLYFIILMYYFRLGKSSQRDVFNQTTPSPGPIYMIDKDCGKESSKAFKFLQDKKMKSIKSITPGPGNYNTRSLFGSEGKKNTIGMRTEFINSSKYNPGPGTYNIAEKNKNKIKTYKIVSGERQDAFLPKDPELPGPGHYCPKKIDNTNQLKWSIGCKSVSTSLHGKLEKSNRDTPAPGSYEVYKSINDTPSVYKKLKTINL